MRGSIDSSDELTGIIVYAIPALARKSGGSPIVVSAPSRNTNDALMAADSESLPLARPSRPSNATSAATLADVIRESAMSPEELLLIKVLELTPLENGWYLHPHLPRVGKDRFYTLTGSYKASSAIQPGPLTTEELSVLFDELGVDSEKFRGRVPIDSEDSPVDEELALYFDHFSAGLTLPMDPFVEVIVTYMGITMDRLYPGDLRKIVLFATLCRMLGVEPSLFAFTSFFFMSPQNNEVVLLKWRPGEKLFNTPENPYPHYQSRRIFVTSKDGWGVPRVARDFEDTALIKKVNARDRYERDTPNYIRGVLREGKCFCSDYLLREDVQSFAGARRRVNDDVKRLLFIAPNRRNTLWKIHGSYKTPVFKEECQPQPCKCPPSEEYVEESRFEPEWRPSGRLALNEKRALERRARLDALNVAMYIPQVPINGLKSMAKEVLGPVASCVTTKKRSYSESKNPSSSASRPGPSRRVRRRLILTDSDHETSDEIMMDSSNGKSHSDKTRSLAEVNEVLDRLSSPVKEFEGDTTTQELVSGDEDFWLGMLGSASEEVAGAGETSGLELIFATGKEDGLEALLAGDASNSHDQTN
ncbi:unnamed protein product, partial [Cuscuta campestris]